MKWVRGRRSRVRLAPRRTEILSPLEFRGAASRGSSVKIYAYPRSVSATLVSWASAGATEHTTRKAPPIIPTIIFIAKFSFYRSHDHHTGQISPPTKNNAPQKRRSIATSTNDAARPAFTVREMNDTRSLFDGLLNLRGLDQRKPRL